MPQKPGFEIPTPPAGQGLDSLQRMFIRNATLFRSKQEVRSVETRMVESSPIIDQG